MFDPFQINNYSKEELVEFVLSGEVDKEDIFNAGLRWDRRPQFEEALANYEWNKVVQENSLEAYQRFANDNPNNPHYAAAKKKIDDFLWEKVKDEDTLDGYKTFIYEYPNSEHLPEAQRMYEEKKARLELEERHWETAKNLNNIDAFEYFIRNYPDSTHIPEAMMLLDILKGQVKQLEDELLEDMRKRPWHYTYAIMQELLNGVSPNRKQELQGIAIQDIATKYLLTGNKLSYQRLVDGQVIPPFVTQNELTAPDFDMPQTTIDNMGYFPEGRTDVYFLGVPRSGKSSVLSGIVSKLWRDGRAGYEPSFVGGIDPAAAYYRGLLEALNSKKPPVSTAADTVSYLKLNIYNNSGKRMRENKITIVEISGEAVTSIANSMSNFDARKVWQGLGATQCLQSKNRKCLFFIIDYSVAMNMESVMSPTQQNMVLNDVLRVLMYDGPDTSTPERAQRGCTMSKVDSVAVIMTKSDLMPCNTPAQRLQTAQQYINQNFRTFMTDLYQVCTKYGINRAVNYQPYILTFSLGKFYVGNTVVFDDTDSGQIINFISDVTPCVNARGGGLFG